MGKAIVLGAGLSGIAASKLLIKNDIEVLLFDNNLNINIDKIRNEIYGNTKLKIKLGTLLQNDLEGIELCVISPEFLKESEVYKLVLNKNISIISELELGYLFCDGEICAITGSNGKATVTALVGNILKKAYGNKVKIVGNTEVPFCEEVLYKENDIKYAIECDSFQLENIVKFKPNVAAILNISPDHLDRYSNYTEYINAKLNIAMNQDENDILVLNYEDTILRDLALQNKLFNAKVMFISSKRTLAKGFYLFEGAIYFKDDIKTIKLLKTEDLKVFGLHNYENTMAAMAITHSMGVPFVTIVDACKEFNGLEHRIEFVREKNGVKYYNDSKSTNPNATIKGIETMKGKIILIVGGRNKGIDYGDLIMEVKEKVKYMILIGEAKKSIAKKARDMNYNNIIFADTLDEAVDIANSYSNIGDNVLFSPACSSTDMFENYKERGLKFKEKVMNL